MDVDEPYFTPKTAARYGWTRDFGLGLKAIWAPKRFDPVVRRAIVRAVSHSMIMESVKARARDGNVMSTEQAQAKNSRASMFTDVVLEMLAESLREDHPLRDRDAGLERRVT